MSEQKLQARVYSRTAPTEEQLAQLRDFLHQKYQRPVNLHWERDDRMKGHANWSMIGAAQEKADS